jgi:hypothetical protein
VSVASSGWSKRDQHLTVRHALQLLDAVTPFQVSLDPRVGCGFVFVREDQVQLDSVGVFGSFSLVHFRGSIAIGKRHCKVA